MMQTTLSPRSAARRGRSGRRGSMLVEMTISAAMISAAMVMTVKVLGYAGQQRRAAEQRQRATLEVANLMERITAAPFDEITPERTRKLTVSPTSAGSLPGAELTVDVKEQRPGPDRSARRVAIRLRWRGRSGEWEAPVRLVTWIERGRPSR